MNAAANPGPAYLCIFRVGTDRAGLTAGLQLAACRGRGLTMPTTSRTREAEVAARWSAGVWRGATLRSERGETFRVIFEGRRGGGAGPDFRDAVLARPDGSYLY